MLYIFKDIQLIYVKDSNSHIFSLLALQSFYSIGINLLWSMKRALVKRNKPARIWGGAFVGGERGCLPDAIWETSLSSQQ